MKICEYLKRDGSSPFRDWLDKLDGSVSFRVQARIMRLRDTGEFGFHKSLGSGLYEMKFKTLGGDEFGG